jgi:hypothetical protein
VDALKFPTVKVLSGQTTLKPLSAQRKRRNTTQYQRIEMGFVNMLRP